MARVRMVTRTINVTVVEVMCVDTSTAEGTESRVLLNAGNADTVDGHSVDDSISDTSSKNVPTTEAVVKYIQSLSYNGEYESI